MAAIPSGAVVVSESVRQKMLDAALSIAGSDGIAAVTNRRIATEAGVSLGSVTYHFATQTDLLRAALTGFVTEETRRLTALADSYRGATVDLADVAALAQKIAVDLAFTSEQFASFELYIQAGRDPELRSGAAECFAAYDALAVSILDTLGVSDAASLAPTLVAVVTGLQLRRLATGSLVQDISDSVVRLIAAGAGQQRSA